MKVLDFRNMQTIQEWLAGQDEHGKDIEAQYNYMKDRHRVEWQSNVEMETRMYCERNKKCQM